MLGFSAYAQTPYSQAVTSVGANAFLTGGAPSTSSAGTMTSTGTASISFVSVSASISTGTIQPDLNKELIGVVATSLVGALEGPAVEEGIVSASVTATAGTLSFDAKANRGVTGVTATTINKVVTTQAKANITLASVQGAFSLGLEPDAQATTELTGVSATYSFNKPTQTAIQKAYSATDYLQSHVVTVHTTIKNKIVYVRK